MLRLHRALLALRRREARFFPNAWSGFEVEALGDDALVLRREADDAALVVIVQLRGAGSHLLPAGGRRWVRLLDTEDPAFAPAPVPVAVDLAAASVRFSRPGAVVLEGVRS